MVALDEEGAHPSIHYEIRLSLHSSAASERKKAATTVTKLGSVCAAHIRRRGPPPHPSRAQHRGLTPSWCRHDAADRVAKVASDGFALVEAGGTLEFVAATAACGGQPSACRPTRFTSCALTLAICINKTPKKSSRCVVAATSPPHHHLLSRGLYLHQQECKFRIRR